MAVARAAADMRTWDPACGLGVDGPELQPRGNPRPTARSRPTPSQGAGEDGHSAPGFSRILGFGPEDTFTGILPRTQALVAMLHLFLLRNSKFLH